MTHFEAPAAKRNEPSAENAREVKHWPEVLLMALRLSDESRPPAMSRLPSIVPCIVAQIPQQGCQLAYVELTSSEFCLLDHSKWCLPELLMLPQVLSSCAMVCQENQRKESHQKLSLKRVPEIYLAVQCCRSQHLATGCPCECQDIMCVLQHFYAALPAAQVLVAGHSRSHSLN